MTRAVTKCQGLGSTFSLELAVNGGAFAPGLGTKAEIGDGWYRYTNTLAEAAAVGSVAIRAWGAGTAQQNLVATIGGGLVSRDSARRVPYGSAGYALGRLSSATITITAPVRTSPTPSPWCAATTTELQTAEHGTSPGWWPDLIGAAISLRVKSSDVDTITGSVVDASPIRIEVTAAQTEAIGTGGGIMTSRQC